ncbi:hypothetical protein H6S82_16035 [Planktothrix sp. FACHB-1355]|nr:hypothetical protein [Planktothrix sp. FACHB-1355]
MGIGWERSLQGKKQQKFISAKEKTIAIEMLSHNSEAFSSKGIGRWNNKGFYFVP